MFAEFQTNYRGDDKFHHPERFQEKLNYLQNYYRHPANKVKSSTKQQTLITLLQLIYTLYHILFEGLLIHHSHLKR